MVHVETTKQIAAIVPAYNEAERIGDVLRVLVECGEFAEIVVVDDGSSDGTAAIAETFPVRVVRLEQNQGKSQAMETGVALTTTPYLFFCDADMSGLDIGMIKEIVSPVIEGKTEMMIAVHNRSIYYASFILSLIPLLAGQRALTRELWETIPPEHKKGYMIESALNFYARYWGKGYHYKVFKGLGQTIKEKKYGWKSGLLLRWKMHYEIFLLDMKLHTQAIPHTTKSFRIAITNIAGASFGALVGILLLVATYTGPSTFVRQVFADDIATESSTPLIDLLLYIAANASIDLLATIGAIILGFNILIIVLNVGSVRYFGTFRPSKPERIR